MRSVIIVAVILFIVSPLFAQIGISTDNSLPDNSAMLDVKSSSKGLLIPRLTQLQIETITNPVNGLLVFCTDDDKFYAFISASGDWKEVAFGPTSIWPSCGLPFIDGRDGKSYQTVQIGTQCWMSQNLNVGTRINGNLPQTNNLVFEKYCFNDLESNCDVYGGLYQWNEMMQYVTTPGTQGICPENWHLPTSAEVTALTTFLGGLDVAGGKMKETGTIHWTAPNTGATNESGFNLLPGSFRDYLGAFSTPLGQRASIYTSTENGGFAWDLSAVYNSAGVTLNNGAMKSNGFSVRCVKN